MFNILPPADLLCVEEVFDWYAIVLIFVASLLNTSVFAQYGAGHLPEFKKKSPKCHSAGAVNFPLLVRYCPTSPSCTRFCKTLYFYGTPVLELYGATGGIVHPKFMQDLTFCYFLDHFLYRLKS